MNIDASCLDFRGLNVKIRESVSDVWVENCCGQRYIGAGMEDKVITICGTPGNALGAYLNGATVVVNGNVQDAVGDTMNDGKIIVNGDAGDALGYAMRGGKIFVRGNAGYRTGIHMKQYRDRCPVIVVGGCAGSFLGEYLAGGLMVVLGLNSSGVPIGNFTGTGMHGGTIFIRCAQKLKNLPAQVTAKIASDDDLKIIEPVLTEYAEIFDMNKDELLNELFYKLTPNARNPYEKLYVGN